MPVPIAELKNGRQVEDWLISVNTSLRTPGSLILIGSGGLLWHVFQKGLTVELPTEGMNVDPITDSEEIAWLCHEAHLGSESEKVMGFHVHLRPRKALEGLALDWESRASAKSYGLLTVRVPAPDDLLVAKIGRGQKRDIAQAGWAFINRICERSHAPLLPSDTRSQGGVSSLIYGLEDEARLDYGRMLWNSPRGRMRLLYIWNHPDHPHRDRFEQYREMVVGLLECPDPREYVAHYPEWSLRTMTREIPAIIWSIWRKADKSGC
jgi:hypothetical protein